MKLDVKDIGKQMQKNSERWQFRGRELWFLCWCNLWHPVTRLQYPDKPHAQTRAFKKRLAAIKG